MEINRSDRQVELDIAKGIGIILVVWAHANGPFSNYIVGFHMPFFFFISGMLYKNKGRNFKSYVSRKCVSLLLPFWWWNLIFEPIFFVLYYWKNWNFSVGIREVFEIITTLNKVPFLGATWFLASLFWVSIFVHLLVTLFGKYKWCDIVLLVVGIAIAILGFQITFPYKLSRTFICLLFYISGYLYKKYISGRLGIVCETIIAIFSILIYVVITGKYASGMGSNTYDNKFAFIIGAYLAIFFTLWLSNSLVIVAEKTALFNHLVYLGENSIDIVIWHFLAFRLAIIIQIICAKAPISSITAFPVYEASAYWWIIYLVTGIYGSLLWKVILEHNPLTKVMRKIHMIR